jgi:alpha-glucosidase
MLRTLPFETDCEAGTENINDEWFLGPFILVAPVLDGHSSRNVFLPSGQWIDYADGKTRYEGGGTVAHAAGLEKVPVFVKAGAIIPTGPVMQYSSERPLNPLILDIYPGPRSSSFTMFEDDGDYGYEQGKYSTTKYDCIDRDGKIIITINARNARGGYAPATRNYILKVHGCSAPKYAVKLNNNELADGWSHALSQKLIQITINDDGKENVVSIDPGAGSGGQ